MKNKFKKISVLTIALFVILAACSKSFFDTPPLGTVGAEQLYNKAGIDKLLIGAYSMLDEVGFGHYRGSDWQSNVSNWLHGDIQSDDAYKGASPGDQPDINPFETYTVTPENTMLSPKYVALFDGVSRCNDVLKAINAAADLTESERAVFTAQARGLRGHYYLELKKVWNMIPYVDENATETRLPNDKDIWTNIEEDFKYAADNLPETFPEVGRINKWAAKAYLAKTYMFQQKYSDAKPILDDIIENGVTPGGLKYGLEDCFRNAFDVERKNGKESVFAVQMSVNDGSEESNNGTWFWSISHPGCCGFFRPSQNLVNAYKTDAAGLPMPDNFNAVDVNSDQGIPSSEPFTPYPGTLDPRLDWTVGRRGIPMLDFGVHPGQDINYNSSYGGPYNAIKYTLKKSQTEFTNSNTWAPGVTAMNYTVIRFSDVLLWAAECEVEVGGVDKARDYVNQVRRRAKDGCYVLTDAGTPAANYFINEYTSTWTDKEYAKKAVRFERRLELATEGHRFFDLVRWGVADEVLNTYITKEKLRQTYLVGAQFVKGKNEYLPIPQSEIVNSSINGQPTLTQNPGY